MAGRNFSLLFYISVLLLTSTEFEAFLVNFFAGDFNGKSQLWWLDGEETPEGRELTSLGLPRVISEPTNFEPGKKPFMY